MTEKTFYVLISLGLALVVGILVVAVKPSELQEISELPPPTAVVDSSRLNLGFTSPQTADTTFSCNITTSAPVTSDTTVQLHSTNTKLISAADGSKFPKSVVIPRGSANVMVSLHTGSPRSNTNMTISVGQPRTDMSNSVNWQASKILVIRGTSTP